MTENPSLQQDAGRHYSVLLQMEGDRPVVSSKTVAKKFGKQHKDVLRAIRNLECSSEFTGRNFAPLKIKDLTGETTGEVLMTRDGFSFLVMGFTGRQAAVWKERFIAAFNEMERQVSKGLAPPEAIDYSSPKVLLGVFEHLKSENERKDGVIAEMEPKVEALERIAEADGSLCITDAAKNLQMRPKDLTRWLASNGWIYKRPGNAHWNAYQSKLVQGVLEHKVTTGLRADGSEWISEQVRVTAKGLTRLAQLIHPAVRAA